MKGYQQPTIRRDPELWMGAYDPLTRIMGSLRNAMQCRTCSMTHKPSSSRKVVAPTKTLTEIRPATFIRSDQLKEKIHIGIVASWWSYLRSSAKSARMTFYSGGSEEVYGRYVPEIAAAGAPTSYEFWKRLLHR
jgi:hypothetical protein